MGDVVNLNRARKDRAKAQAKEKAQANRAVHGVSLAEKAAALVRAQKARRALDQKKRETPEE